MKLSLCFALTILFGISMAHAQVTGSGTDHTIPIWTGTTSLGNSPVYSIGGNVGIGTKSLAGAKLNVVTTSTKQNAITGTASATSGNVAGLFGFTASPSGVAVGGVSTATGGTGIYGAGDANGVSAYSTTTTGEGNGLCRTISCFQTGTGKPMGTSSGS